MTVPQFTAFLVWYKTGLEGTGTRSLRKACKITKHSLKTLVAWSEDFDWESMAKGKDAEIQAELEEVLISSVLEAKSEILKRQRVVISKLYKKLYVLIDRGYPIYDKDDWTKIIGYKPMRINFPDMIRLLEYEASLAGAGASRVGENLVVLLKNLPSEDRIGFITKYRALRESGEFLGPRLGPERIVPDKTRH